MNITLRQLRYFDALAQQAHFGRAAEACAVSQPALSMQIRELEAELGSSLIDRSLRQVQLTAFGEAFLQRARNILREVDDLGDLARSAGRSHLSSLRLGVIPTIAPYLLPRLIGAMNAHLPGGIDLHIRESVTPQLLTQLSEGKLDAAIVALPVNALGFEEVPLLDEHFVLVRPWEERGLPAPPPEDLAEMRLLLLEEGHCFRDQALAYCGRGAQGPKEVMSASALTTLVQMVAAGIGVTLIPELALAVEGQLGKVAVSRFEPPAPGRRIGLIWRRGSPLAAQLGEVAELARDVLEGLHLEAQELLSAQEAQFTAAATPL